jgi:hypothetical protein
VPPDLFRHAPCGFTVFQPFEWARGDATLTSGYLESVHELGELEVGWGVPASDVKRFENRIRDQVCAAGGVAVKARLDVRQRFVGGTVYGVAPNHGIVD